ncbi:hypothetical protein ACWDSL_06845 [Streptomyces sp. NPDC000941]
MSHTDSFLTLFSNLFGEGGYLEAEVTPEDEVTIRSDRWSIDPLERENGAWVSGSVTFKGTSVTHVRLTVHHADSEPWASLGDLAGHMAARDLEIYLPHARARAASPLRALEEPLRRARFNLWAAERGDSTAGISAARNAFTAAEAELLAHGGNPDLVWPNRTRNET